MTPHELVFADMAVPLDDGSWVNAQVARVVEVLADYDPNLEVRWIPRERREEGDAAFAIVERCRDGGERVAFYVATEAEFDHRVLARVFAGDTAQTDVNARLEATNAAARALELKRELEERDNHREFAASVLASPLHSYRHAGLDWAKPNGGRQRARQ